MTRVSRLIVVGLALGVVVAAGCAKRPALMQAAAPAPTGAGAVVAAPPAPVAVAPAPPVAAPEPSPSAAPATEAAPAAPAPERPATKEFVSVPELNDIRFDFDKSDIRPADARVLDANADWLKSHPDQLVLIEGHCDERGTNQYNLALGDRRANATRNYLVARGVQSDRMTIISYGEERPICTEHNERCWSQNRRAHFLVKPR